MRGTETKKQIHRKEAFIDKKQIKSTMCPSDSSTGHDLALVPSYQWRSRAVVSAAGLHSLPPTAVQVRLNTLLAVFRMLVC